ncbi:MAG TPA: hypothetical protein VD973_07940 [Symbiobacteriaceae bacterium]|jgi:hypothetical protein|nr:hypothetical protein [Symbiobacteriaceae bacterium]
MKIGQGSGIDTLRAGLRTTGLDDYRLFVRRQVAEQNSRVKVSPELREAARLELAPGGYWSPEAVTDRIIGFATAWAGDDPDKLQKALAAVRKGFADAEKMLGGLPEVSQRTRELVERRFEQLLAQKA